MEIHKKNYIHHDLHSGNIFSYTIWGSVIGDLGLCQQVVDKKDNPNKIFGVIPYLLPEVLFKKKKNLYKRIRHLQFRNDNVGTYYTFHDRSHNHFLITDILKEERPQIT